MLPELFATPSSPADDTQLALTSAAASPYSGRTTLHVPPSLQVTSPFPESVNIGLGPVGSAAASSVLWCSLSLPHSLALHPDIHHEIPPSSPSASVLLTTLDKGGLAFSIPPLAAGKVCYNPPLGGSCNRTVGSICYRSVGEYNFPVPPVQP